VLSTIPATPLCGGAKENGFVSPVVIPSDFSNSFFRGTFFLSLWFLLSEKYFGGDFRNAFILRAGFSVREKYFPEILANLFFWEVVVFSTTRICSRM
jgi:hypothetical protein